MLTVVYTVRDRPVERLVNSINSLRAMSSGMTFNVIVVDYGCDDYHKKQLEKSQDKTGFQLIRTETQGFPWSRGKAMNIGIYRVQTEYFISTDIDMVFESDIISETIANLGVNKKIHCRPHWLPRSGKKNKSYTHDNAHHGAFMVMRKEEFLNLGGFSENIMFWGMEDTELNVRAEHAGFEIVWLPRHIKMYHVWHPISDGLYDQRPLTSVADDLKSLYSAYRNNHFFQIGQSIGDLVRTEQRPILEFVFGPERVEWVQYDIPLNTFNKEAPNILRSLIDGDCVVVKLGPRFFRRTLRKKNQSIKKQLPIILIRILNKMLLLFGLSVRANKNSNQDYCYAFLESISAICKDYYWDFDSHEVYFLPYTKKF
jgi:hypothetical protein